MNKEPKYHKAGLEEHSHDWANPKMCRANQGSKTCGICEKLEKNGFYISDDKTRIDKW